MRRVPVLAMLSFVLLLSAAASGLKADVSTDGISYQGLLSDESGVPVADGPKDLILSVWSDPVGGTMLHSELVHVTTSGGLFSTCLGCGSTTFSQIFEGQSLYLQTQVAGEVPMVPRTVLGNVPSAMSAGTVHSQTTQGAARSRGIITNKPGAANPKGRYVLEEDSDGDFVFETRVEDSVSGQSASRTMGHDNDEDGVPDQSIDQVVTPTTSSVAIQTKGTGADKNRVIQTHDSDEDGDPESTIDQAITPTTCGVAINTKGTGADKGRIIMTSDPDSDGDAESTIDQAITPTTCGVAINTKGTGADKGRIIMTSDPDSDGDPESTIDQSITPTVCGVAIKTQGMGADKGRVIISTDTDEDDDSEGEVELSVTPGTCGVAIQTKGTGADKNRVIGTTDDTTASMVMATDSATIAMKVRHGGTVKGGITVSSGAGLRQVDMGSDGNAFFATGVGIGVDPTHPVEVAGGAYCDGTNWVNASDVNSKENFERVNGEELLARLNGLEITKWNYKGDLKNEHIGPTAQGFKEAFGVGSDGKSISTIDPSGIALAAIQELSRQNHEVRKENAALKAQLEELSRRMDELAASR